MCVHKQGGRLLQTSYNRGTTEVIGKCSVSKNGIALQGHVSVQLSTLVFNEWYAVVCFFGKSGQMLAYHPEFFTCRFGGKGRLACSVASPNRSKPSFADA